MSQIYKNSASGPVPPSVATSYVTDSGTAIPVANILNVLGNDSTSDNDNGISTTGSGNTVTAVLSNRLQGSVTTVGATTSTIISFNLGATPASYMFELYLTGFESVTPTATGYWFITTARTTGAAATVVGTNEDFIEDAALGASDVGATAAGNVVSFTVTGVAGLTINWKAVGYYVRAV